MRHVQTKCILHSYRRFTCYTVFSPNNSYMMLLNCWEAVPDKRPSFKTLYTNASKIIEGIAGYLEMGFNPFTAKNTTGKDEKRCRSTE